MKSSFLIRACPEGQAFFLRAMFGGYGKNKYLYS